MYRQIPYITYQNIIDTVQAYLAIIGVYNFREILSVDPDYTAEKVIKNIVMYANREFSKHMPLLYVMKLFVNNEDRIMLFDNFNLYVNGQLDPENIVMVPDTIIGVSSTHYFHPKYNAFQFSYQPPYLILRGRYSGILYLKTLCKYRLWENQNDYLDSRIYFMEINTPIFDYFAKQVVYNIGLHISMLKKNYTITELPIDVFSGLEEYVAELKNELETFYTESAKNYLLFY